MTVHTPHFCLPEFSRAGLQGRRVFKLTKAAFITKGEGRRSANCAVGKLFNSREYFSGGKRRMFSTNWPRKRVVILANIRIWNRLFPFSFFFFHYKFSLRSRYFCYRLLRVICIFFLINNVCLRKYYKYL